MIEWILVVFLLPYSTGPAVTAIAHFDNEQECRQAGKEIESQIQIAKTTCIHLTK